MNSTPRHRILSIVILGMVGMVFFQPLWLILDPLGGDDSSYYSHAATLALDGDLDYSNEPVQGWAGGGRIARGSFGTGPLAAPFMALFSIVDRIQGNEVVTDHSAHQYSWTLAGFAFASLFYFLLGVWLYWLAGRLVWPRLDPRLNLLIAFSTGVPFYVFRRFSMSHAYEFAAAALGFWAAVRIYRALASGASARAWIIIAAIAAGIGLTIRIANLNVLFLAPLVLFVLRTFDPGKSTRPSWIDVASTSGKVLACTAVALVPLAVFNLHFFGAVYPGPVQMTGVDPKGLGDYGFVGKVLRVLELSPNVVRIIFSSEFGILYTNPLLVFGGGFLLIATTARAWRKPVLPHLTAAVGVWAYMGLSVAIVLWWQTTASSYGYRYLFPLHPLAFLGFLVALRGIGARTHEAGAAWSGRRSMRAAIGVVVAASIVSITAQAFYLTVEPLQTRRQVNVFGVVHEHSAKGYVTALPGALLEPYTWLSLAARRLPGFLAGPAVMNSPVRRMLPAEFITAFERVYASVPPRVYAQMILLLACWMLGGYLLLFPPVAAEPAPDP